MVHSATPDTISSIVATPPDQAFIAIVAILGGDGETERLVPLASLLITAACLAAATNAAAIERG